MNYPESLKILEEVKKAKKILLNCHRGPDSDSVGSSLAMLQVLERMGKTVSIICPSEVPGDLKFLSGVEKIKQTDFASFDFSVYDLFLTIDSSNYSLVSGSKDLPQPDIPLIVIDHHLSNVGFGEINLIDANITSSGELLFRVFEDWGVELTAEIAECLLTGIIGDTGSFQHQGVGKETLEVGANLIGLGADKDKIIYNIYRNIDLSELKMWGKFIENMQIDKEYNFVWSAVSHKDYKAFGEHPYVKEDVSNLFSPIVKGTDFGIVMVETNEKILSISLRSRTNFDVSKIAEELGGGGHKAASGARVEEMGFDEAVEKVLTAARKYARKT